MRKVMLNLLVLAAFMAGCASYIPQPNLAPDVKTISVPVFINKTDKYGLEQYVTQKTIDEFLADGRVTILDEYQSDAVIKCAITKYAQTPILFDNNQVPQQYRLRIYVNITFFDNKQQRELWLTKDMWEETTYYVVNNLGMPAEDEERARQRVLDQLSSKIMRRVIYGSMN